MFSKDYSTFTRVVTNIGDMIKFISIILAYMEISGFTAHVYDKLSYSPIRPIFMPDRAKALRADWAPGPGVLVLKY
jgi:hypothetical protein